MTGHDPDIVFEHPGRQTMGASVFVCARGGTVVTCAATTGYMIEYDNRHLWMKLKTIKGSHFSNYREAWSREPARLRGHGSSRRCRRSSLSTTWARRRWRVHRNQAEGKLGVLCLAPTEGLGIDDPALRAEVGEERLTIFRRHARP